MPEIISFSFLTIFSYVLLRSLWQELISLQPGQVYRMYKGEINVQFFLWSNAKLQTCFMVQQKDYIII